MQAKSTIQFKFDPNKEYKCPKDKIDALVEFITNHVQECPLDYHVSRPSVRASHVERVFTYTRYLQRKRHGK